MAIHAIKDKPKKLDDNHPNILHRDWRLQYIATYEEDWQSPGGEIHKSGETEVDDTITKYLGRKNWLGIPLPSPSAMYLSLAFKAKEKSKRIFSKLRLM
jgi:hypothetical protein